MDKKILEEYTSLEEEVKLIEERLDKLRERKERYENEIVVDRVQCGDIKTGHAVIEGYPSAAANLVMSQIKRNEKILQERLNRIEEERNSVEEFISSIDDSRIRIIATKKYIQGKTWNQIAREKGEGYTPDAMRTMFDRYFMRQNADGPSIDELQRRKNARYFKGNA